MGAPIENKFTESCGKIWGKVNPKGCSGREGGFKNILIRSNCSYLKKTYLTSEMQNKLHDASTISDKEAKQKQRAYVKTKNPVMQAVVNLTKNKKKAKKRCQKKQRGKENMM